MNMGLNIWPFRSQKSKDRRTSTPAERHKWEQEKFRYLDQYHRDELDRRLQLLAAEAAVWARKEQQ